MAPQQLSLIVLRLLNNFLSLKNHPNIKIAGQITGVEGYLESAAIGLLTGIFMAHFLRYQNIELSPPLLLRPLLVRQSWCSAKLFNL
ncbi:FAD-dependent oxidoreductase [Candidatus Midichloria mitochondrii]|uniref:FAD-dependent oxidoreductase n=1 Tax=Candidatus Midichloria mitochondrii TaxID=234827 RepID=UPI00192C4894